MQGVHICKWKSKGDTCSSSVPIFIPHDLHVVVSEMEKRYSFPKPIVASSGLVRPCLYPPSEAVLRGLRAAEAAVALLLASLEFLRKLRLKGDDFFELRLNIEVVLGGEGIIPPPPPPNIRPEGHFQKTVISHQVARRKNHKLQMAANCLLEITLWLDA